MTPMESLSKLEADDKVTSVPKLLIEKFQVFLPKNGSPWGAG